MPRFSRVAPFLLISLAAALSACSSTKPAFQDDQLLSSAPSPFSHGFNNASTDACEASRRALLSQGYMTTMTRNDTVDATKNFQPTVDQHIVVEVHVVCTPADATNTSMVYVNAVQNGYTLKKSATSASVGLSILGSVSLPIHSNSDEMVKVSSQTIQSDAFYKRFFDLVGRYLNTVARSEPVPGSGDIKSTPLPPPLEPDPMLINTAAPGASAAPAAAAAAAAAAATGAAVLHTGVPPATPVQGSQAAAPAAAASGVHAVFPASPASQATLLTPVLPAPAASAPAAATSPASSPAAASAPAGANRAAQPGAAAAPASGASATQAAASASGASATQAAAPASGATAAQAAAQPAAASAAAPAATATAPSSATHSGTATSSPAPAGGTQNVVAANASGAANAPASNSAPAAATTH
ncbi:DUF2242 domain-containing protein [Paraburkholderia silviterrae]|uniref:DUF2242 domain-containing protein n=1 Tax=Paraburkholderia silviterrae TaxID=2528715 RepID=A0A4R5MHA3_9BURK|nr:DUF2242 domain-containing protein [Paraburkholderia silviterrae]TDG26497.1 DUF2242 domain-containing protein [Paraburkholderia silviterrae]